jgi:hypothetical protein
MISVVPRIPQIAMSGAQRAIYNQTNGIIANGFNVGQRAATTLLTGGVVNATGYSYFSGNTFRGYANVVYAFGNQPLNVTNNFNPGPTSFPNVGTSYLTFKNKINIPVSSSQIDGQLFVGTPPNFGKRSNFLLASGTNPLFVGPQSTSFFANIGPFGAPNLIPSFFKLKFPF